MSSVVFIEESASKEQIRWGGHSSPDLLVVGKSYEVERIEVHSCHTRVYLVGIKGYFNSVWFEDKDGAIEKAINNWGRRA